MNPSRHTYLAQRILWSARQFLQVETPPLHLGGVEACDFPKCGKLGSIICESWGLRSRSPLNQNLVFLSFVLQCLICILQSSLKTISSSFHRILAVVVTNLSFSIFVLSLSLNPFFKTNKVTTVFHFIVDRKTIAILKGNVYRQFDWSARQHESISLLGLLAKIKV